MAAINRNGAQPVGTTAPDGQSVGRNGKGGYGLFANRMGSGSMFHPTVLSLLVLVLLEFAGYVALRYAFKSVHGG